jgi:hypothetical protein
VSKPKADKPGPGYLEPEHRDDNQKPAKERPAPAKELPLVQYLAPPNNLTRPGSVHLPGLAEIDWRLGPIRVVDNGKRRQVKPKGGKPADVPIAVKLDPVEAAKGDDRVVAMSPHDVHQLIIQGSARVATLKEELTADAVKGLVDQEKTDRQRRAKELRELTRGKGLAALPQAEPHKRATKPVERRWGAKVYTVRPLMSLEASK